MTWFSSKKDASWSRPTAIFFKMKNFIIFLLFFITNFQNNGVLSKNRFNVIDAKNSRIYHGPGNPNRRDLSSFILRAKPTSIPSVKYFTGIIKLRYILVLERTVRCSRTVRFFVMFGRFEVRFWSKKRCSEKFEVRF